MIIWLASYPKSGNTWLRSFIVSLLSKENKEVNLERLSKIRQYPKRSDFKDLVKENDFENIEKISKNWIKSQEKINLNNKYIKIFKTHHVLCNVNDNFFTNYQNTLGAIYIVRDPRSVVSSISHHFLRNIDEALEFILNDKMNIGIKKKNSLLLDSHIITPIASWGTHYNSWKLLKKNFLILKYENLVSNPSLEFNKLSSYLEKNLKIEIDKKDIDEAIIKNSFENLKKIEEKRGFSESSIDDKGKRINFFNLGPNNNWKKLLNKNIIDKIEKRFSKEMGELGYL